MPLNNPKAVPEIRTGTYTGDNAANRAIPHGLRSQPKIIFIYCASGSYGEIIPNVGAIARCKNTTSAGQPSHKEVTNADTTNFYVGNGIDHAYSFNATALNYYWVALA